jgi:predicted HicB family RNase H-like nuclease
MAKTINIDNMLHRKVKAAAAKEGKKLAEWVMLALTAKLAMPTARKG